MKINYVIEEVEREIVFTGKSRCTGNMQWYKKVSFILAFLFTLWCSLDLAIQNSTFFWEVFVNRFILFGGNFVLLFIFIRKAKDLFKSFDFMTASAKAVKLFFITFCAGGMAIKFVITLLGLS